MRSLLYDIFIKNWQRKGISLLLALIIWLVVDQSLTTTKIISNVPVKIIHLNPGKTVEGLQTNGFLSKRITLTLVGSKTTLEDLSANDFEVVIDAADKQDEWVAVITKKNLVSLNPEVDLSKTISRVSSSDFIIRMTKLVTENIPVYITPPIGSPPRGYQFLDVWPYQLTLKVSGPEKEVKQLKARGIPLTFNLNNISKDQLDALEVQQNSSKRTEVSFFIPDQWKQVDLSQLSDHPIEIEDPQAKELRIDFIRYSSLPLDRPVPLSLFFPVETLPGINPDNYMLAPNPLIQKMEGVDFLTGPLHVTGVNPLFLEIVQDMFEIVVVAGSKPLAWSVQFINPRVLEDQFISAMMSDVSDDDVRNLQPSLREDYLRNRFRSYMNRFQLLNADDSKFELNVELQKK